jgi:hypothetical protein
MENTRCITQYETKQTSCVILDLIDIDNQDQKLNYQINQYPKKSLQETHEPLRSVVKRNPVTSLIDTSPVYVMKVP